MVTSCFWLQRVMFSLRGTKLGAFLRVYFPGGVQLPLNYLSCMQREFLTISEIKFQEKASLSILFSFKLPLVLWCVLGGTIQRETLCVIQFTANKTSMKMEIFLLATLTLPLPTWSLETFFKVVAGCFWRPKRFTELALTFCVSKENQQTRFLQNCWVARYRPFDKILCYFATFGNGTVSWAAQSNLANWICPINPSLFFSICSAFGTFPQSRCAKFHSMF